MDDKAALLAAILAHPEEDTPRLMYADKLDEQGQEACPECGGNGRTLTPHVGETYEEWVKHRFRDCPVCKTTGFVPNPRAEFIRVQCELAKYPQEVNWLEQMPVEQWSGDAAEGELLRRLAPLVTRHTELCKLYVRDCAEWSREFVRPILGDKWLQLCAPWQWGWSRGFVSEIELPCNDFIKYAEALFLSQPIERVRLTDRRPRQVSDSLGRGWTWSREWARPGDRVHTIPDAIRERLPLAKCQRLIKGYKRWDTPELAEEALSIACTLLGREKAKIRDSELTGATP